MNKPTEEDISRLICILRRAFCWNSSVVAGTRWSRVNSFIKSTLCEYCSIHSSFIKRIVTISIITLRSHGYFIIVFLSVHCVYTLSLFYRISKSLFQYFPIFIQLQSYYSNCLISLSSMSRQRNISFLSLVFSLKLYYFTTFEDIKIFLVL